MTLLDLDSAAAKLRALQPAEALTDPLPVAPLASDPPLRFYKPLSDAVDEFVSEAQDQKRIYTGIDAFDDEMRGVGGGHTMVIVGYSHSGKTQLFVHMLRHNSKKRIALFTEDEPATLVLAKLASVQSGVNSRQLETLVAQGDTQTIGLLRAVADEDFPNLIVFDQHFDARTYGIAWEEAQQVWGQAGDMMAWDYLELINTGGETVQQKFDWVKSFGKTRNVPNFVIHQTSRSAGAEGRKMTISSGSYGGEQHATFMIGVRRRKAALMAEKNEVEEKLARKPDDENLHHRLNEVEHSLSIAEFTLTANLVKNKRPGGGLVDDIEFEIVGGTGALIQLEDGELPRQHRERAAALRGQYTGRTAGPGPTRTFTQPQLGGAS